MKKRYLFVCGAPRSGTTALWAILNCHRRICLTMERYSNRAFRSHDLAADLFTEDRLFDLQPGDTFYPDWPHFVDIGLLRRKFADAEYVGDKLPRLYEVWNETAPNFPDAQYVVIVRNIFDVAMSYNARASDPDDRWWTAEQDYRAAVADWNAANAAILAPPPGVTLHCIAYEDLFRSPDKVSDLYDRLGLSTTPSDIDDHWLSEIFESAKSLRATRSTRELGQCAKRYVCMNADMALYREIVMRMCPG